MAHAEKCPVCNGSGQYRRFPTVEEADNTTAPIDSLPFVGCHGCGGKGWIEVGPYEWGKSVPPYRDYGYPWYPEKFVWQETSTMKMDIDPPYQVLCTGEISA